MNSVFAIDYRGQSLPVAIVDCLETRFAPCLGDTDFGEVVTGENSFDVSAPSDLGGERPLSCRW